MGRQDVLAQIPSASNLRRGFRFIGDQALRGNIANTLRHVTFLVVLQKIDGINGPTKSALFKDCVLHCASVVEGLLHYAIQHHLRRYPDKNILEEKWTELASWGEFDVTDKTSRFPRKVFGVLKEKRPIEFKNTTDFISALRIARRAKIFGKSLAGKCDKLREMRNRIHLSGLEKVDDGYSKEDVVFALGVLQGTTERVRRLVR